MKNFTMGEDRSIIFVEPKMKETNRQPVTLEKASASLVGSVILLMRG